jgi:tRNA 2-thiouridine synthesizing protein E
MTLTVRGREIGLDEEGFLLDRADWSDEVAERLAEREGIRMTDTHWGLVGYFRDFFAEKQTHPTMHQLVRTLGKHHGERFHEEKAYEAFLYELFPKAPVARLCKLAGLPKPEKDME